MTILRLYLLLLPLVGSSVPESHVRRRDIGLRFSVAKKKVDVAGPDPTCHQQDVDEILASCDCAADFDGVAWKNENDYMSCLIVHKTFTPCGLQRIIESSPCLPFPTPQPTTSSMPSTSMPSSVPSSSPSMIPSTSMLPSSSSIPSSIPSQSLAPSVEPSTQEPSSVPSHSIAPSSDPSYVPSDLPSLVPSELRKPSASPSASPSLVPSGSSGPSAQESASPSQISLGLLNTTRVGTADQYTLDDFLEEDDATKPFLEIVGDNQWPPEVFPLSMCQGDCDGDKDCKGDLQCMPRDDFEPVPGCQGAGEKAKDYCADPKPPRPWSGWDAFYKFKLRLFYDPLYFWQEAFEESWWCMECTRCSNYTLGDGDEANCTIPGPNTTSCMENDNIWIMGCKRDNRDYQYNIVKNVGSGDQIRVDSTHLCFSTLNTTFLELKTCNNTDYKQLWMPITNLSKFVLQPYEDHLPHFNNSLCLTQMHHPKSEGG
ncbi:unnamed protein product [Cylindrotheca closterium]|uniref:Ricin B lectin domain-containing protein n=1 Tax=Cylindrotheca closterium TaxID=2856 RepID=A0AAD2CBE6_9STRA|nr:unnamed protein product [Cylindrotheca closterium]